MNLSRLNYTNIFITGLILNVICAWFSTGYHHPDEHYQVLEFCNYIMGRSPSSDLPWEFTYKMRSALLPGIAYLFGELMGWFELYNPFTLAFLLRLFTGVCSWFVIYKSCLFLLPQFKTSNGKMILVLSSMLLWFVPYLSVRFTSENISGLLFIYSAYLILSNKDCNSLFKYAVAGILLGTCCFIRMQMGAALSGFFIWLIIIDKTPWSYMILVLATVLVGVGLNIIVDHWFYREWLFTPYNYYYENIILNKSSSFGIQPWWNYFVDSTWKLGPPLSLLLLPMFIIGLFKNLKNPFVWSIIPFLLLHCLIEHKEFRFLFSISFVFIYIFSLGFDDLFAQNKLHKSALHWFCFLIIAYVPLLLIRTLLPADLHANVFKYVYQHSSPKGQTVLYIPDENTISMSKLRTNFYLNDKVNYAPVDNMKSLRTYLQLHHINTAFFVTRQKQFNVEGYTLQKIYPKYNIYDKLKKTRAVWQLSKLPLEIPKS